MKHLAIILLLLVSACGANTGGFIVADRDEGDRVSQPVVHEITNPDRYVETEWGGAVLR